MRLIGAVAVLLLSATFGVLALTLVARLSDGPIGPLAGGPFRSGELVSDPDVDWAPVAELPRVELQLVNPPRSRTTHFLVYDDHAYVPCGIVKLGALVIVGQAFWKQWPHEVLKDPRVILRINGKRYERRAVKVTDSVLHQSLSDLLSAKYRLDLEEPIDSTKAWFYRLAPREE